MATPRTSRFDYSRLLPFIGPLALPLNDWANSTVEKRKR